MAATGVIKRIDEAGRVVIPREIRQRLFIHSGDPLEITADMYGIRIKKYEPEKNLFGFVSKLAEDLGDAIYERTLTEDERDILTRAHDMIVEAKDLLERMK